MKKIDFVVAAKEGIHARPAGFLVKKASEFSSALRISLGEKSADARKLFAVMKLGAKQGDTITVSAEGEDEDRAIAALADFLEANF